jgi:hypothetical protein
LLGDDETRSYWDHITGECVHGKLKGKRLETFPIEHTNVARALKKWPDIEVALSRPPFIMRLIAPIMNRGRRRGFLPPGFRKTMGDVDARFPEMESGLGIVTENVQRFYPIEKIKEAGGIIRDEMNGREILLSIESDDHIPHAVYTDSNDEEKPMQLFTRWYGFI